VLTVNDIQTKTEKTDNDNARLAATTGVQSHVMSGCMKATFSRRISLETAVDTITALT